MLIHYDFPFFSCSWPFKIVEKVLDGRLEISASSSRLFSIHTNTHRHTHTHERECIWHLWFHFSVLHNPNGSVLRHMDSFRRPVLAVSLAESKWHSYRSCGYSSFHSQTWNSYNSIHLHKVPRFGSIKHRRIWIFESKFYCISYKPCLMYCNIFYVQIYP